MSVIASAKVQALAESWKGVEKRGDKWLTPISNR